MPNDLLRKYLNGEAIPHEIVLAEEWINANEANGKYFETLKITIEANNNIAHNEEAWFRLQSQISKNHSGYLNKPERKFKARWVQLIVSTALLCLIGYIIRVGQYINPNINLSSQTNILTETLPDGSTVTLNAHSKLSYPAQFAANKRVVSLAGEAFFKIATDADSPLIINLKGISISTTDATILVENRNSKTKISVKKGTARVISHANQLLLQSGEAAASEETGMKLIKTTNRSDKPTWLKEPDLDLIH